MYREVTYRQARTRAIRQVVLVVVIAAIAVALYFLISAAQAEAREQAAIALRDSVLNTARQCCAVEGFYPQSLEHLEEYYGLSINHDEYVVSYEWFADNIMPTVVVTLR